MLFYADRKSRNTLVGFKEVDMPNLAYTTSTKRYGGIWGGMESDASDLLIINNLFHQKIDKITHIQAQGGVW